MGNENYDVFAPVMIKDWMNDLIDSMEHRKSLDKLNSQIETITTPDHIHIDSGLDIMADALGLGLTEEEEMINEYYVYHFYYRDVKFFQLSKERLGKYARTD